MNISDKLDHKLRMLREVNNYSEEYVTSALDIAPNMYFLLVKGQTTLSIEHIEKLAQSYNMDVSDFPRLSGRIIIHQITYSNGICSENISIRHNALADEEGQMDVRI